MTMVSVCFVIRTGAIIALLLMFSVRSNAQDMPIPFQNFAQDMFPSEMYAANVSGTRRKQSMGGGENSLGSRKIPPRAGVHPIPAAITTYTVSPAVAQKVKIQYIAWAKTAAPDDVSKIERDLETMNIEQIWGQAARDNGFKAGDAIDAVAGYYLLNWAMANSRDASATQAQTVRKQIRASLERSQSFRRFNAAQRQELAEALMINYLYQVHAYVYSIRKPDLALKTKLADAASARFQHDLGIDPHQLTLTKEGFAAKR